MVIKSMPEYGVIKSAFLNSDNAMGVYILTETQI